MIHENLVVLVPINIKILDFKNQRVFFAFKIQTDTIDFKSFKPFKSFKLLIENFLVIYKVLQDFWNPKVLVHLCRSLRTLVSLK